MKKRSPLVVCFLSVVTIGIYTIVWNFKTSNELYKSGGDTVSPWLMFVPVVNIWWLWRYHRAAQQVIRGRPSSGLFWIWMVFFGLWFIALIAFGSTQPEVASLAGVALNIVGLSIIAYLQTKYNRLAAKPA